MKNIEIYILNAAKFRCAHVFSFTKTLSETLIEIWKVIFENVNEFFLAKLYHNYKNFCPENKKGMFSLRNTRLFTKSCRLVQIDPRLGDE